MNSQSHLPFLKMNGLGNEIAVLDLRGYAHALTAETARAIGRLEEAQFDQLMVLHDPQTAGTDAFVRIYNSDGSEAGACGNGTRCVAWALLQGTDRTETTVETAGGLLHCVRDAETVFTVDMGAPRFGWRDIPLAHAVPDVAALPITAAELAGLTPPFGVSMGNPHAVFIVADVAATDVGHLGPLLEHDALFPERANISFAEVRDDAHIVLRVWERGAGETRACGSGACATAVAAIARGLTGRRVTVTLPGGDLVIAWRESDSHVLMTGPVELEWSASLPPVLLQDAFG